MIRDLATGEAKWIKRLRIVPYAPRNYVSGEVAFNARQRTIVARFRLSDPENKVPSQLAEKPVKIAWQNEGLLDPSTPGNFEGKPFHGLAVGYPDRRDSPATATPQASPSTSISWWTAFPGRSSITSHATATARRSSASGRSREIEITAPPSEQAYKSPREELLPIEIAVDAPEDAFQPGDGDLVEVGIDLNGDRELSGEEKAKTFFGDRQVDLYLDEAAPGGRLKIGARVDDFHVPLDFGGLNNKQVAVMAQLVLSRRAESEIAASHSVDLIFDGVPPRFTVEVDPGEAPQGESLDVSVRIEPEPSGVRGAR